MQKVLKQVGDLLFGLHDMFRNRLTCNKFWNIPLEKKKKINFIIVSVSVSVSFL